MNLYHKLLVRIGLVVSGCLPLTSGAEVLFKEHFDDQADFTSTMHTTLKAQTVDAGNVLPQSWYGLYQGTEWSPETGYPNNHASLEILSKNADKARGGQGKSAVNWRESYSLGWKNWASDSQLVKVLDSEYKELYVEFYIRFSPNWYGRENESNYTSKIFRVGSWDGVGDIFSGFQGGLGPIMLWDYKSDPYGVRNVISFRGGPHGENYTFNGEYTDIISWNYGSHTKGMAVGGEDPQLLDKAGSGYLVNRSEKITHDQVFGASEEWTKMAFYVRINSRPGAPDGVLRQWVDGVQILNKEDIPWVQESSENKMVGWNYIAIGGNDYFQPYPNERRFEDWYSIDDLVVRNDIPDTLIDETGVIEKSTAPRPPANLKVD